MADLLRLRRRPTSTTNDGWSEPPGSSLQAAARVLEAIPRNEPQPRGWHPDAWRYRNTVGELRYAEMWLGNSMGRARLLAARRERPGAEPTPLEEGHPASELVARLAGGVGGQSALLRSAATYLMTPGLGYIVGLDPQDGGAWSFMMRSAEQVRLSPSRRDAQNRPMWEVAVGDATTDWVPLGDGGIVVEVMRPDPQRAWEPDSPVRGAMPILNELVLLTQHIEATAVSRLAGAGILPLPQSMQFEKGWTGFVQELVRVFTKPIKDRNSAAAVVPFPVKVPDAVIGKLAPVWFHTPFDEHALELRQELLQRLGIAMDMPQRALTGESENHWGQAQRDAEGTKLHTVPNLEIMCDALTVGYLTPGLIGNARLQGADVPAPDDGQLLARATRGRSFTDTETGDEIIVWYDLSDFTAKPDKGEDAVKAYDRWQAPGDVLRAELGLSEAEVPDDSETERRVWLTIVEKGSDKYMGLALTKLGFATEDEIPEDPAPPATAPPGDAPAEDDVTPPEEQLPGPVPDTEVDDEPPEQQVRAAGVWDTQEVPAAPDDRALAVVAACDAIVYRALERMGNRLRTATARQRVSQPSLDVTPVLMHTVVPAYDTGDRRALMAGAWERVPVVAAQLCVTPDGLRRELSRFVDGLVAQREPYSWEALHAYLSPRIVSLTVTPRQATADHGR